MVNRRVSFYMDKELADKAEEILKNESFDLKILCRAIITKTAKEGRSPLILNSTGIPPVSTVQTEETKTPGKAIPELKVDEKEDRESLTPSREHVKTQNNPFANLAK